MNYDYKPSYLRFILLQMTRLKKNRYIEDGDKKYIESKKTANISSATYLLIILFFSVYSNFRWYFQLKTVTNYLLAFLIVLFSSFVLETIHWFYAKFNLEENQKETEIKN